MMDPNRQSHLIHLSPPPWAFLAHYRVQWPDEEDVEGFKETYLRYLGEVENLGYEFVQLVAEALGLPPDGLARFYDAPERMQHRSKVRFVRSSFLFLFFALAFARACVFFFLGGGDSNMPPVVISGVIPTTQQITVNAQVSPASHYPRAERGERRRLAVNG
jgi:hypothetical protein